MPDTANTAEGIAKRALYVLRHMDLVAMLAGLIELRDLHTTRDERPDLYLVEAWEDRHRA